MLFPCDDHDFFIYMNKFLHLKLGLSYVYPRRKQNLPSLNFHTCYLFVFGIIHMVSTPSLAFLISQVWLSFFSYWTISPSGQGPIFEFE